MNDNATQISLDAFLTLVRYAVIAWCFKNGVTEESVMMSYVNLAVAGVTVLWGLSASGYFARAVEWFKGKPTE